MYWRWGFPGSSKRWRWRNLRLYFICNRRLHFVFIFRNLTIDDIPLSDRIIDDLIFFLLLGGFFRFIDCSTEGFFSGNLDFVDGFIQVKVSK
jgi:hypothetical protein